MKTLTAQGTTVVCVSHDVDFCADFADTCALLFDGEIACSADARTFFRDNLYYTTQTSHLFRKWNPDLLYPDEAREWLEAQV